VGSLIGDTPFIQYNNVIRFHDSPKAVGYHDCRLALYQAANNSARGFETGPKHREIGIDGYGNSLLHESECIIFGSSFHYLTKL
jgi:hypothetical protein